MAITGINTTTVNGVAELTTPQTPTGLAAITGEQVLITGSGRLRASGTGEIIITDSNIFINNVGALGNPSTAVLSYNGDDNNRADVNSFIRFRNTKIIYYTTNRKDVFISELTDSEFIQSPNGSSASFMYTQSGAILDNCLIKDIGTWEVFRPPTVASGILVDGSNYGYLNWEAGRLDFLGFSVSNIGIAHAWLGAGNGGNNSVYHWNNDSSFNNTLVRHQSANNKYFDGLTISWKFIDRDSGLAIEDVLVILKDDFSGSMAELGRYTTNVDGKLTGTYNSQTQTAGANQVRETIFIFKNRSNTSGNTYSSPGGGQSYSLVAINSQVEVRSYLYQASVGFLDGDNLVVTSPIGALNANYTVKDFQNFNLVLDANISETDEVIVLGYTELENAFKLYDRAKKEWFDNDGFPLLGRSGNLIDAGSYNVTIDATASTAFDITGNLITIKASTFTGDMVTTGLITLANGAIFNGTRTDANGTIEPDQPISITNISAGSRLRIYNVTTGTETVNTVVSGTSYTSSYQEGTGYNDGDTIRIYLTKLGKEEWVGDVIDTSNGFNVLASQVDDDVYTALGVDGTTVTKFQADYVNNEVDLVIGSDWTMAELYAWWANNLTTEDGIRNFFGGITAIDQANFRINTSIVDLYLDNTTNASYKQTDNRRFFRDTGTGYPVRNPTTSGYGLDVVWRNTILIAQAEAGGTSDLNFYDVKRAVKQVITNPKYIKGQK